MKKLNVWYLHLAITIDYKTKYFPQVSKWYIIVDPNYPKRKDKGIS